MGLNDNELEQEVEAKTVEWFWSPYHKAGVLHDHVVNELLPLKIKRSPCSLVISMTLKTQYIGPFILNEKGAGSWG